MNISEELAELIGTFTLVFIGAGAMALAVAGTSTAGLAGGALAPGLALAGKDPPGRQIFDYLPIGIRGPDNLRGCQHQRSVSLLALMQRRHSEIAFCLGSRE